MTPPICLAPTFPRLGGALLAMTLTAIQAQGMEAPPRSDTQITLGLGAALLPRYPGSKTMKFLPVPVISVKRGCFFAGVHQGLGLAFQPSGGLTLTSSLRYDLGRTEKDSDWRPGSKDLAGMGEIRPSALAVFQATQTLTPWLTAEGEAEFRIGGQQDRGNRYHLGLTATSRTNSQDTLSLGIRAQGGDRRYNQTYFGVTQAQSTTSRFSSFQPGTGLYACTLAADWIHPIRPSWAMLLSLHATRFIRQVEDSPLVEKQTQILGLVALSRRF